MIAGDTTDKPKFDLRPSLGLIPQGGHEGHTKHNDNFTFAHQACVRYEIFITVTTKTNVF